MKAEEFKIRQAKQGIVYITREEFAEAYLKAENKSKNTKIKSFLNYIGTYKVGINKDALERVEAKWFNEIKNLLEQ